MILSAIWNKLNEFTELHERSECNSLNEFNLSQMAQKIISFDNNQMGQLPVGIWCLAISRKITSINSLTSDNA